MRQGFVSINTMKEYDYKSTEAKWQKKWIEDKLYETDISTTKEKMYVLDMFPYPSGDGLHVGHPKGYIATDIYSRMKKMKGYEVLHPMGWDAYGLPAEQYAIANKVHPKVAVEKNIKRFKEQLAILGFNYDWSKELNTTDPEFYRWTQWIWKQMFKNNLAYQSHEPINWCPLCLTGLANEDLEGGKCERCGSEVEKKPIRQWVLKITDYAERMLKDLDELNWPEHIKESQRNWIGKSEGAEFDFELVDAPQNSVKIFTTRADTLFGATFVAISAELASTWLSSGWKVENDVKLYVSKTIEEQKLKLDYSVTPEKTGIFSGIYAINSATKEKIPVWIANYVLGGVGTGAIMAVPAHDERDFEFAKKYNLPVLCVITPSIFVGSFNSKDTGKEVEIIFNRIINGEEVYVHDGKLRNSDSLNGLTSEEAKTKIIESFGGKKVTRYKLQDWVFARQRYWGEPFPIVFDENQNPFAVADSELPVKLPEVKSYEPTGNGESPLANIQDWVEVYGYLNESNEFISVQSVTSKEAKFFFGSGNSKIKDGIPITKRKVIDVILKDKEDNFYLLQDTLGYKFIGGGIEDNENETIAVIRETIEESGFTDFTVTKKIKQEIMWTGYHEIKNINVECSGFAYEVVLNSDTRQDSEVEQGLHTLVKFPKEKIIESLFWDNHKLFFQEYLKGNNQDIKLFKRETNTMPQWAGSSWYYLRYIDPKNTEVLVDKDKEKKWSPVDFYVGGAEHATRHLIYARFYHKFLFDIGVVSHSEPFKRLQNVGLIQAEDGRKMSKRFGNVVNPDEIIRIYGADTLRVYEMFMGPFDQSVAWSTKNMGGSARFLERVWRLSEKVSENTDSNKIISTLHKTIKKVTEDIESFKFNTAISSMMIFTNTVEEEETFSKSTYLTFLQLLAPFAPHITEELWSLLGNTTSIHLSNWPKFDESKMIDTEVTIALQISGKMRDTFVASVGLGEEEIHNLAKNTTGYKKYVGENTPKKVIIIQNKLINVVL